MANQTFDKTVAILNKVIANETWLSPAKLNLFLHITGRRADGFHELQTVFQLIDYCDELTFSLRTDGHIFLHTTPNLEFPLEQNLILRAAKLLHTKTQCPLGVDIKLYKKIPIGGGLGGGSSNAATTLLALNKLWELNISGHELSQFSLQLGADVPFFVEGKTAWAEGIGEKIQPLELPEKWFVVLIPPIHVSTAKIFSNERLTRDTPTIKIHQLFSDAVTTRNDCEQVVRERYPLIAAGLNWLNQYGIARLTGTGSCCFLSCENIIVAQEILRKIPKPFNGFVAKGLNYSPSLRDG